MATPTVDLSASPLKLPQLPARALGFEHVPAVPVDLAGMLDTLLRLQIRFKQREQALQGLSRTYTISGETAPAAHFLLGRDASPAAKDEQSIAGLRAFLQRNTLEIIPRLVEDIRRQQASDLPDAGDPLTKLPLDDARQWAISWTTFPDVPALGDPHLDEMASTIDVTQPDKATEAFWPTFARHGRSYNLLLPEKVREADPWRALFGAAWTPALDAAAADGLLYVIDLRIYEPLQPQTVAGSLRFTPSTVTVLVQDPASKALTPELIRIAGGDNEPVIFSRRASSAAAWVYAIQAAKVSVTVFGIWLGHVYHWHIVPAALIMTMYENLPEAHPVHRLIGPHSNYLIPFDDLLLLGWSSLPGVPPTSIATAPQFLELIDRYAAGRTFFDDDPPATLARLGLTEADFTVDEPWDQFPIVGDLLEIWEASGRYVDAYVANAYASDEDVRGDLELRRWIAASGRADDGNVRGLPELDSADALKRVLHSIMYRITAHGGSRLYRSANPVSR